MNNLEITTAHNVTLRMEYASIGDRLLAGGIDILIKLGILLGCGLFIATTHDASAAVIFWVMMVALVLAPAMLYFYFRDYLAARILMLFCALALAAMHFAPQGAFSYWLMTLVIFGVVFAFYSLVFEYFMNGQTPGKRMFKIRVVSEKTDRLSIGQCLTRWLFRMVDFNFMPGIGIVTIAISNKRQRIGDMLAGTVVINVKPEKSLDDTIYAHTNTGQTARYEHAARLSPREVEVIKEVLRQYEDSGNYDLIPVAAERVRKAISASEEQDDLSFLRTVVQDYYILAAS